MKNKRKESISKKSQLIGELLSISEMTTDKNVYDKALALKKMLTSYDAGTDDDNRLQVLQSLLFSAKEAIGLGLDGKSLDMLDRFEFTLKDWQLRNLGMPREGGKRMNFFKNLSKTARENKRRDEKIESLQETVRKLDQMSESVALKVETNNKALDQLKIKAAQLNPGSVDYLSIKSRYDHLNIEKKTLSANFQSIQKALQTNKLYLETLLNVKASEVVNELTPASLVDMEYDLSKASQRIQESVETLNEGAELASDIAQEIFESYEALGHDSLVESDFDEIVADMRMSDLMYKATVQSDDGLLDQLSENDTSVNSMKDEVKPE